MLFRDQIKWIQCRLRAILSIEIEFGKSIHRAKNHSMILFPTSSTTLGCGISALVAFKKIDSFSDSDNALSIFQQELMSALSSTISKCITDRCSIASHYLGGDKVLKSLLDKARSFKTLQRYHESIIVNQNRDILRQMSTTLASTLEKESDALEDLMTQMDEDEGNIALHQLETLRDIHWCLSKEILDNFGRIQEISATPLSDLSRNEFSIFKQINAILNSIDRLEVRGRDSAGISLLFTLEKSEFEAFRKKMSASGLGEQLKARTNKTVLSNNCLTIHDTYTSSISPIYADDEKIQTNPSSSSEKDHHRVSIAFVYKYAAEIGSLGDNVAFLRTQIKNDQLLQLMTQFNSDFNTISAHTRWASVGDITLANCHPVDSAHTDQSIPPSGIIHVSLNGDIDNYPELKRVHEARFDTIHPDITTDTKIIPLQIERYLKQGHTIPEAFRLAVNDFHGSHAISMHTDLAPGKLFLAQKGSGQALFIGIAPDHYVTASELYGVVEETQSFIKLNGETNGQIIILDQTGSGGVDGMLSMDYAGNAIEITDSDIQKSDVTSRDIDRQNYPHYFLKEISEAPISVSKTLQNRWKRTALTGNSAIHLDESVLPMHIVDDLKNGTIKKVFFIGQGTAGVAAQGCADLFRHFLPNSDLDIRAMKSSELSGFSIIGNHESSKAMASYMVIAISQSGTTTDTNRTVDMVRARGARTLAIVNRRDSDLTFKVDGVLYTSTGRDIEMSVASTKAFYSQITAGALLALHTAGLLETMSPEAISKEIDNLIGLPNKMRHVLGMKEQIAKSAKRHAIPAYYWATVGSGANKTSADEIRIKLSELCYKTISSDYVEDKKHIDLSSEPLIIVCAASTRESVLKDIIKDTAIFHAHKAIPIVITDEDENRFLPFAKDVFGVPKVPEHLAPILNTLVGHLWGYYAALAIHEGSEFIFRFQNEMAEMISEYRLMGRNTYEILLEKAFREKVAAFYQSFSKRRQEKRIPAILGINTATDITLLLKYLSGRLPVAEFEMDFGKKGTPANMLDCLFKTLSDGINALSRPVDAIKHQAKTVTVGTSRLEEKQQLFELDESFEGVIFDEIKNNNLSISRITHANVLVIRNLQKVISHVKGALLYQISGLNLLGEPTLETRIDVINKSGSLTNESSRVETEHRLKGTKNIIVREGNVYIGKGRKDGRSILVIPVLSERPNASAIENLLSLNVAFKETDDITLIDKIKALGGKYTRIKDTILESDTLQWADTLLNTIPVSDLFGDSAEKIADTIIAINGEGSIS